MRVSREISLGSSLHRASTDALMNTHITITLGKGSHMACKCKNVCKACGLEHRLNSDSQFYFTNQLYIPATAMLAEAEDGLLLATVQV